MLKWIAQNKYKLMAFIIGLYLLVDVLQHKGQARVLFPKNFTEVKKEALLPQSNNPPDYVFNLQLLQKLSLFTIV